MSQKLEVGDELLSINDKTMSRLTFDEIMEFIIEADAERVDLLFRRPVNAGGGRGSGRLDEKLMKGNAADPMSPGGLGGLGSNSNSVKWIDEGAGKKNAKKESSSKIVDSGESERERKSSSRRSKSRDDPSVDDTYTDAYTVESQSQYTMDTYDDKYYRNERGGRHQSSRRNDDRDGKSKRRSKDDKKGKRKADPIESGSFLDLLIDTLCTSVMGRDANAMCVSEEDTRRRGGTKYDEDDDFTVDDGTYATYDEPPSRHRKRDDEGSLVTEDEGTFYTEDDGTRTMERNDESYRSASPKKQLNSKSKSKESKNDDDDNDIDGYPKIDPIQSSKSAQQRGASRDHTAPDPPTKAHSSLAQKQADDTAIASSALPLKELEYDDRIDYAADVSVMESLGGPSLLVERARHEHAVSSGANHAAQSENLEAHDPELAELVAIHGEGFVPDAGMTKEETAFRDPYRFYEHAVCALLQDNEPEKVRLLSKLMAKYRGRERHLINKLSARYNKEGSGAGQGGEQMDSMAKPSMSGMEKIHEGGEDEEVSSALNDPTRANMAAIESVKKRVESETNEAVAKSKSQDDGWPPAMSDPWGTGVVSGAAETANVDEAKDDDAHEETLSRDRPTDDDEGSYSVGSSYTGDSGDLDGTSPAIIAQVSELLNYVYGKTSVAGQIDRVSTIMRAYEGREAVLLELLETKALIKANADSSRDASDLPSSIRNKTGENDAPEAPSPARRNNIPPQTPVSMLSDPTMAKSPQSIEYPETVNSPTSTVPDPKSVASPSEGTFDTTATGKKKKKGIFGGFFGGKKNKGKGTFPSGESIKSGTTNKSAMKAKPAKTSKKGQQLDDGSI